MRCLDGITDSMDVQDGSKTEMEVLKGTLPEEGRVGRPWRSLLLENVVEPTLGPEQLAAGLIVGDPVLQVGRQLRGLHLQREGGVRPDPDLPGAQPSP